jgi:hypothetical protein
MVAIDDIGHGDSVAANVYMLGERRGGILRDVLEFQYPLFAFGVLLAQSI